MVNEIDGDVYEGEGRLKDVNKLFPLEEQVPCKEAGSIKLEKERIVKIE